MASPPNEDVSIGQRIGSYFRWERTTARAWWRSFWSLVKRFVWVEVPVTIATVVATFLGSSINEAQLVANVGGHVLVIMATAFGFLSLFVGPYDYYKKLKAERDGLRGISDIRRDYVEKFCNLGRSLMGQRVTDDNGWNQWDELFAVFTKMVKSSRRIIGSYDYLRITNVEHTPRRYLYKFNDEHEAKWNTVVSIVQRADAYLERL